MKTEEIEEKIHQPQYLACRETHKFIEANSWKIFQPSSDEKNIAFDCAPGTQF